MSYKRTGIERTSKNLDALKHSKLDLMKTRNVRLKRSHFTDSYETKHFPALNKNYNYAWIYTVC